MSDAALTDDLADAARKAFAAPFAGILRLVAESGDGVVIDGRGAATVVGPDDPAIVEGPGVCVLRAGRDTLVRSLENERLFAGSFVSGRLRASGDMSVLARISMERPK